MVRKKALRVIFPYALWKAQSGFEETGSGKMNLREIAKACASILCLDESRDKITERQVRGLCEEYERGGWIKQLTRFRFRTVYELDPEVAQILSKPTVAVEKAYEELKEEGVDIK
ncbi:hypothetical protein AKJ58_00175 [candidate division MSBL1 archaeon SCGC-AAA385D11]|uniref:Uncharacterized protein n=1 Tax=candidate division MSBL1 archaeon SCGC-AAA385D11 TaxID=1698286 RepID=A0A133VPJ4_9EURY|nr:hypothetical protein AKJ58_00175 [candidate division MSBL1 archaeon SCGC-AAA385D11]